MEPKALLEPPRAKEKAETEMSPENAGLENTHLYLEESPKETPEGFPESPGRSQEARRGSEEAHKRSQEGPKTPPRVPPRSHLGHLAALLGHFGQDPENIPKKLPISTFFWDPF